MQIQISINGRKKTVRIEGQFNRLDRLALIAELKNFEQYDKFFIDLTDTSFLTTHFFNILADIRSRYPEDYKKIIILNPNEMLQEIFEITHLNRVYKLEYVMDPITLSR